MAGSKIPPPEKINGSFLPKIVMRGATSRDFDSDCPENQVTTGQVTGPAVTTAPDHYHPSIFRTRPAATLGGYFNAMTPNLQIEYRAIDALLPYARNPRTHSPAQIARVSRPASWNSAWTSPLLVDGDNGIIAGHGRLAAARKLGTGRSAGDRTGPPEPPRKNAPT
jgi:hypothetical protein